MKYDDDIQLKNNSTDRTTPFTRFIKRSPQARVMQVSAAFVVYALAYLPLRERVGVSAGLVAIVPVIVAGWTLGWRGGLLAGLAATVLHTILMNLAGHTGWDVILRETSGLGLLAMVAVGIAVGYHSDLIQAMREQIAERKQAEEKLRSVTSKLETLVKVSPLGIFVLDAAGSVELWNPAAERMFGWKADEVIGLPNPIVPPAKQGEYEMFSRQVLEGSPLINAETTRQKKDGSLIDVNVSSAPLYDPDGNITGRMAIVADISERKCAEEKLRESEQKYSAIFDKSPYAIALNKMPENVLVGVNDTFLKLFEFTREEVIGKTSVDLGISDPDSRARVGAELQARGYVRDFEVVRATKSGAQYILSLNLNWVGIGGERHILTTIQDITARKQAEDDLRTSESRLRTVLETSPVPTTVNSLEDGVVLYGNSALANLLGVSLSDVVGRKAADYYADPADRLWILDEIQRHGFIRDHEVRLRRPDGSVIWVSLSTEKANLDGRPCLLSCFSDITARKQAEEALGERSKFASALVDTSPALIYVYDLETNSNVYSNRGIEQILGYTAAQVKEIGTELFTRLIHPDDLASVITFQGKIAAAADGDILEIEYRMQNADGRWVNLHSHESPFLRNQDGLLKQKIGVAIDVTERKRAEEALRDSESRLRLALEASRSGAWMWNVKTNEVNWSEEYYRILGYDPHSIKPTYEHWLNRVHADDKEKANAQVAEAVEKISDLDIEFRIVLQDGTVRWINDRGRFVLDASGQPASMYGIQVDITDRKQAEKNIQERADELERFNRLMVGRELRMIELKQEVNELHAQLGRPPRYALGSTGTAAPESNDTQG